MNGCLRRSLLLSLMGRLETNLCREKGKGEGSGLVVVWPDKTCISTGRRPCARQKRLRRTEECAIPSEGKRKMRTVPRRPARGCRLQKGDEQGSKKREKKALSKTYINTHEGRVLSGVFGADCKKSRFVQLLKVCLWGTRGGEKNFSPRMKSSIRKKKEAKRINRRGKKKTGQAVEGLFSRRWVLACRR